MLRASRGVGRGIRCAMVSSVAARRRELVKGTTAIAPLVIEFRRAGAK